MRECHVAALGLAADTDADNTRVSEIDAILDASVSSGGAWRPVAAFADRSWWQGDGTGPSRAPADMVARLARQHVFVQRTIRAAALLSSLDDSGPAFADSLFLLSAMAAAVLSIAATAIGRVLSVRRRGYELAALEAVGVSPRTLRRATAAEQGSVFAIGLSVGLAAGLLGSWLALPSTPVFVDTATGPPLVLGLPWGWLAALTGGLIVVFVLTSLAVARLVQRAATPARLRGAQP